MELIDRLVASAARGSMATTRGLVKTRTSGTLMRSSLISTYEGEREREREIARERERERTTERERERVGKK